MNQTPLTLLAVFIANLDQQGQIHHYHTLQVSSGTMDAIDLVSLAYKELISSSDNLEAMAFLHKYLDTKLEDGWEALLNAK